MRTRKLLWLPVVCLAVALALPAAGSSKPTARFLVRPPSPVAGEATIFDASTTSCDLRPCTYRWRLVSRTGKRRPLRPLGRGKILRHTFRRSGVRYLRLIVRNRKRQKSLKTRRIVVSNLPGPAPAADVTLEQIDGGVGYYGQFKNPLSDSPHFFPVSAWLRPVHDQAQVDRYKDFGLNVLLGLENPELTQESLLRANGLKAVVQSDERTRFNDIGTETAGWFLYDEIDMCCGPPGFDGGNGYDMLDGVLADLPRDGRFRYNNYGKGVLEWESDADAARFINGRSGPNSYQHVVATDYYWFTDPNAQSHPRHGFGSSYGDDVRRVRRLDAVDGARMPVWHVVELGWPFTESAAQGGRRILPAEVRSAVWHVIIAGARGIVYFDHNFGPGTPGSTIHGEGYEDNRLEATALNAQIKALAPVLNSPFVMSGHSASDTMDGAVRYMVKWSGGKFYVFAGADRSGGAATFSIPCVGDATAVRLARSNRPGEQAAIPVNSGSWTDEFADKNAVHIYRIDGGAGCGLPAETAAPAPGPGERTGPGDRSRRKRPRVGRLPRRVSLRSGRLVIPVRCVAACTVRSRLTIRRGSGRMLLGSRQRRFRAGRHKLHLRLSKRGRHRVSRAQGPLRMRLRTVIVERGGGGARRTQHLVARRR
ncbi:MAG TPA: hypothetical protein VE465_11640 [Streptosporangiaceae bacterium]|nr:hypothetical protein [Streptosporangiaceae bacterium]